MTTGSCPARVMMTSSRSSTTALRVSAYFARDSEYALEVCLAAARAGASWVVLCDTNGGSMPAEIRRGVEAVRQALAETGRPVGVVTMASASRPELVASLGARIAEIGPPAQLLDNPQDQTLKDFLRRMH